LRGGGVADDGTRSPTVEAPTVHVDTEYTFAGGFTIGSSVEPKASTAWCARIRPAWLLTSCICALLGEGRGVIHASSSAPAHLPLPTICSRICPPHTIPSGYLATCERLPLIRGGDRREARRTSASRAVLLLGGVAAAVGVLTFARAQHARLRTAVKRAGAGTSRAVPAHECRPCKSKETVGS